MILFFTINKIYKMFLINFNVVCRPFQNHPSALVLEIHTTPNKDNKVGAKIFDLN